MFNSFENVLCSASGTGSCEDNTDYSLSGTSKLIKLDDGESVTITFDEVDLSSYDEISMQLSITENIPPEEMFSVTMDGVEYIFDYPGRGWKIFLFEARYTNLSSIIITSKIDNFSMFLDVLGYRKVTFESMDKDVIKALAGHVSLDFVDTTILSSQASVGDSKIYLESSKNMTKGTKLLLEQSEEVTLKSKDGSISGKITEQHAAGSLVEVLVPVRFGGDKEIDNNPVCGVLVYDRDSNRTYENVKTKDNYGKYKVYLGKVYVMIYIECYSEGKLLELSRQYEYNYGDEFTFLLDGQVVDIYAVDKGVYTPDLIGNTPRMSYKYAIKPQPYTRENSKALTDINLQLGSKA